MPKRFACTHPIKSSNYPTYTAIVNHTLAFELYLKCLLAVENGFYYEGHKLVDLFRLLKHETQDHIITTHDKNTYYRDKKYWGLWEEQEGKFMSLMENANNAFIEHRYIFEVQEKKEYDMSFAIEHVKAVIIARRPEFESK